MDIAKLTTEGNQQIIVVPEKFHLSGSEVYFKKMGNALILTLTLRQLM